MLNPGGLLTVAGVIIAYVLLGFIIYAIDRKGRRLLSPRQLALAFAVKVIAGCAYGYIFLHYYHGDDTWAYHQASISEYAKMVHTPGAFFKDLLPVTAINGATSPSQILPFYIMDLEYWLTVKTLAIFNVFSRGNYYINVVFFNFIVFWGHYFLFSLMLKHYPSQKRSLFVGIFLLPPIIFWLSGIRGDGYLFFFVALLIAQFQQWLDEKRVGALVLAVVAFTGVTIFRPAAAILFVPALTAWWLSQASGRKPLLIFAGVYMVCVVLFFASALFPAINFPSAVCGRQQAFFQLKGNTRFALDTLEPTPAGFARTLPQAVTNTFFRPYAWEAQGILQAMSAAEIIAFWLIFILFFFWGEKKRDVSTPLLLTFLFWGVSLYLLIGYTVPFPGAIVRYKCIGELLLLLPFFARIRWPGKTH